MPVFASLGRVAALQPAAMTVRQQERYNDLDRLSFRAYLREVDVRSLKVSQATTAKTLFVADRRQWDTNGGTLSFTRGDAENYSFLPIEMEHRFGEEEMQEMYEATTDPVLRARLVEADLVHDIPGLNDEYTRSIRRRIQLDFTQAWTLGTQTVHNRHDRTELVTMRVIPTDRFITADTPWDDAGVNAFEAAVNFLAAARRKGIDPIGLRTDTGVIAAVIADAPKNALTLDFMGQSDVEASIAAKAGIPGFQFVAADVEEGYDTVDPITKVKTRTSYWPAGYASVIPRGRFVGDVRYAPIVRAADLAAEVPEARININRIAVFFGDEGLMGKALRLQYQLNAFPWLDQDLVYTINTGVAS